MVGDQIVLDRDAAERYQPTSGWKVLFDLAALRRPEDAVAFVKQYGLLRHGPDAVYMQEPFSTFLESAHTFSNLLDLYHLIRGAARGDKAALATLWEEWSDRLRPLLQDSPQTNKELLVGADRALAALVSEGLRDAPVEVDSLMGTAQDHVWEPGTFALAPRFRDLLGVVYFDLAMMLSLQTPLHTCAECGRHFAPRNPQQRYHNRACALKARRRPPGDSAHTVTMIKGIVGETSASKPGAISIAFPLPQPTRARPRPRSAPAPERAGADSPR